MRKEYLEAGKIVGTHGVRGELRFELWCDAAIFLKKFKTLYFGADGTGGIALLSCRAHGNVALIKLEGIDTVADAAANRNRVLYIRRADARLNPGDYFIQELIGCTVTDADTGKLYGVISDVSQTGANDVWHIVKDGKETLIPAIRDVVAGVDVDTGKVVIRPLKGLFDDD